MYKRLFEYVERDINENVTTGMMIPAVLVGVHLMVASVCMLEKLDHSDPAPDAVVEQLLPFELPVAEVGDVFSYDVAAGYQIPLSFELTADLVEGVQTGDVHAYLSLRCRKRNVPGQVQNTEGIWIEGVLSGTPYPGFNRSAFIDEDLSGRNRYFLRTTQIACDGKWGTARYDLAELLAGSGKSLRQILADGRLDVVVADDVEIRSAGLCFARPGTCSHRCIDHKRVK